MDASDAKQPHARRGNPADYRIFPERRIVSVKFGRRVTAKEIAVYALSLQADPLFRPEFSEIIDLREVEELDLNGDEMLKLAEKIDPFAINAKRAFVVRNSTQTHAARIHQILRLSKENFAIVRSIEEAERWIRFRAPKP